MFKISIKLLLLLFLFCKYNISSQTTNQVTYEVSNVAFDNSGQPITFYFNCDGGPCETGQFVTGDYWVAPNTPNGKVTITNITPVGNIHGAMVNADLLRDNNGDLIDYADQKQGLFSTYENYLASLNLMTQLPYNASGGDAIFKVAGKQGTCGTEAINLGCVDSSGILTILSEIPNERGINTFRPPFTKTDRPMYTTDKVRMDRLPRLPQATGQLGDLVYNKEGEIENTGRYAYKTWLVPQLDIYSKQGEFMRATIPHSVQIGYAADQCKAILDDMYRVFGEESNEEKKQIVYAIIQKGIDNYSIYKQGLGFNSGAGQFMGKKPPIAFFAALYDDKTILEDIRGIATDPEALSTSAFQADSQIRAGRSGMAIWGEDSLEHNLKPYFKNLYPSLDRQGGYGDPYDYIDGPAGGIYDGTNDPDNRKRNYMSVSVAGHIGYSFLQHLMPWFKYAAGDDEILQFADRYYDGYGIDNFDGGMWTLPDPVAPKDLIDLTEANGCAPDETPNNCINYTRTWGPLDEDDPNYDEDNPKNNYVAHDQDPNTYGRMPHLHGAKIVVSRMNRFIGWHWNELRPCSDPSDPSYPCAGLGAKVPEDVVLSTPEESFSEKITITKSKEHLVFKTTTSYNTIEVKIYSITGSEIINDKGAGNSLEIKNDKLSSGIYFYNMELDGIRHTGKLSIKR